MHKKILQEMTSLDDLAKGGVLERFKISQKDVLDNIMNLNTDPTKVRKITIEVAISASKDRRNVFMNATVKTKLQPFDGIELSGLIVKNEEGELCLVEHIDPQLELPLIEGNIIDINNKKEGY